MFNASAVIPWPANAASPCSTIGITRRRAPSPSRVCLARARPSATG